MIGKFVGAAAKRITTLLTGVLYGAAISILPVMLINHDHLDSLFTHLSWQQQSFMAICLITASTIYMRRALLGHTTDKYTGFKLLPVAAVIYLFCYTACAVLCQIATLTTIGPPVLPVNEDMNGSLYLGINYSMAASAGLLLVILAAIMQMAGQLLAPKQKIETRPIAWSWLLFMAGVPLVFGVWLPLIALPGAFIALKWLAKHKPQSFIN